jgi:hypothetical protein
VDASHRPVRLGLRPRASVKHKIWIVPSEPAMTERIERAGLRLKLSESNNVCDRRHPSEMMLDRGKSHRSEGVVPFDRALISESLLDQQC